MKPSFFRVSCAIITFLCGAYATSWQSSTAQSVESHNTLPCATPSLIQTQSPKPVLATSTELVEIQGTRIGQQEIINLRKIGDVRITAYESEKESSRLVFDSISTGKQLLYVSFGMNDPLNPRLRFKVLRIKGMSDPLIVALGLSPGGSDSYWEATAIGIVNGRLEEVTYERLSTSNQGGLFFGDLGGGLGTGAAEWNFIWGEDEGHYQKHQYEMKIYTWNSKRSRFEWHKVIRTSGRFNSGEKALRSLGLHLTDIRKTFPEYANIAEW